MRATVALLLSILLPASLTTAQTKSLAFTHATVIDMTGEPPRPDVTVIVVENRITAFGKSGKVRIPAGAQVVNAKGKYLIPGLWDMHVHLAKAGENTLPLFVANGVTVE